MKSKYNNQGKFLFQILLKLVWFWNGAQIVKINMADHIVITKDMVYP